MTPTGIWCCSNGTANRFKGRGIPSYGTHFLAGILVLLACTATTRAQGGIDNTADVSVNTTAASNQTNCFVAPEVGPCNGRLFRYYFHWGVGQCFRYEYSGCGGTGNNFKSRQKCMRTCWPLNYQMYCRTGVDQGPCQSWSVRYYYSTEKNHCFPFYYSGCGGNLNNFRSEQECRAICIAE
ncbi:kunitz-type serine protease inhibitor A-like isoform X1 [Dermacentor albipictus]|uniref:kunitz-type serine protease inhibitor A-like isoform X1 n=1 Tax=Dermacentor albipictus TaxID=60249 RepID=UPI0031FBC27E